VANAQEFDSGLQLGLQRGLDRRAEHQARANEIWEDKRNQLKANLANLNTKYSASLGPDSSETPASLKIRYELEQAQRAHDEFDDPVKKPGLLQKIEERLHLAKMTPPQQSTTTYSQPVQPSAEPGTISSPGDQTTAMTTAPPGTPGPRLKVSRETLPASTMPELPSGNQPVARTMSIANPAGLLEPGNINITNRPLIENADGTASSEYSTSMEEDGKEVLVPTVVTDASGTHFLTPDGKKPEPGSAEEKAMFQEAWKHYKETGQHLGKFKDAASADSYAHQLHNRGNIATMRKQAQQNLGPALPASAPVKVQTEPRQLISQAKAREKANQRVTEEVDQLIAAGPISPAQQAVIDADAANAGTMATVRNSYDLIDKMNLPEDQKKGLKNDVLEKVLGIAAKPNLKAYLLPGGQKVWLDANHPEMIPPGATATSVNETADSRKRADYQEYLQKHPEYKGTEEQWLTEQSALGRYAALSVKPPNKDDRYISINEKALKGEPLSADDRAYMGAYDLWFKKRILSPVYARAAAMADDRYTWVYDLNDPDKQLKPMRMRDAARFPVGSPQSIAFKADMAMTRYMTSGEGGRNLSYFNTATEHLKMLQTASEALDNGDMQLFNKWSQDWAAATGNPAPTNFDSIRNAVAGELAKTFSGVGATEQGIADIQATVNRQQSPGQLAGAIYTDIGLMQGKVTALYNQFEEGKEGQPNFPAGMTPGAVRNAARGAVSGGDRQKIWVGTGASRKHYQYKGTGNKKDLNNYTEIP
jgi:hypothetical protein